MIASLVLIIVLGWTLPAQAFQPEQSLRGEPNGSLPPVAEGPGGQGYAPSSPALGQPQCWKRGDLPPTIPSLRLLQVNAQGCPEYELSLTEQVAMVSQVTMVFVLIPAGTYEVGAARDAVGGRYGPTPPRTVTLDAFLLAQTECTQLQWQAVMGRNPSRFSDIGQYAPVESVSWGDIQAFERRTKLTLPSSTQWEVAALADGIPLGPRERNASVWHKGNSAQRTHVVGARQPNGFGLFDMLGNVREWCEDSHFGTKASEAPTDGSPWLLPDSPLRSLRGGGWSSPPYACDARIRDGFMHYARSPNVGFRAMFAVSEGAVR